MKRIIFNFLLILLMVKNEANGGQFLTIPDIVESNGISYKAQDIIELLVNNNPNNLMVNYKDEDFQPKEFLKQYPTVPTKKVSLKKDGEVLDLNVDKNFFMIPFPTPKYVGTLSVNGVQYNPKQTCEVLSKENPTGLKVNYNNTFYDPSEFYKMFENSGDFPNYMLMQQGQVIKTENLSDFVPYTEGSSLNIQPVTVFGITYQPQDLIELLAQNNPHKLTVKYKNNVYTPKEYRNKFRTISNLFQFMKDGKVLKEEDAYPFIPWTQPAFPTVTINDKILTPQQTIEGLSNNNPHGLKVSQASDIITPKEYLNKHKKVPTNFQLLTKDDSVIPKSQLMFYLKPLMGIKSRFPVIKFGDQKFSPQEVVYLLSKNNPNNLQIVHDGTSYDPIEFVKKFSEDLPQNFDIHMGGKRLTFKDYAKRIPFPEKFQTNMKPVEVSQGIFSPRQILELLIKQHNGNIQIFHNNLLYTPDEFIDAFRGRVPKNFIMITPEGVIETDNDIIKYLPTLTSEKPKQQVIDVDGVKYDPEKIIKLLTDYNPHQIVLRYNDETYTPKEFILKFKKIPDNILFVKDDNYIDFFDLPEYVPALKPSNGDIHETPENGNTIEVKPNKPENQYIKIGKHSIPIRYVLEMLIRYDFQNTKIHFNNVTLTPEEVQQMPELPDELEFVKPDGEVIEPDKLPSLLQTPFTADDPRLRVNNQLRYPNEIVFVLKQNNPNNVHIKYDNQTDPVDKFIKEHPELPNEIEFVTKDGDPIKPSELPEKIPGLKEYDPRIKIDNQKYYPNQLVEMINKNNPKNLTIQYNNRILDPDELLEFLSVPGNIEFVDNNGKPVKPDKLPEYIPELENFKPTIHVNPANPDLDPEDLIHKIIKDNPDNILIRFENRNVDPIEFLKLYPNVPSTIEFVKPNGEKIPIEELPKHVPELNPDEDNTEEPNITDAADLAENPTHEEPDINDAADLAENPTTEEPDITDAADLAENPTTEEPDITDAADLAEEPDETTNVDPNEKDNSEPDSSEENDKPNKNNEPLRPKWVNLDGNKYPLPNVLNVLDNLNFKLKINNTEVKPDKEFVNTDPEIPNNVELVDPNGETLTFDELPKKKPTIEKEIIEDLENNNPNKYHVEDPETGKPISPKEYIHKHPDKQKPKFTKPNGAEIKPPRKEFVNPEMRQEPISHTFVPTIVIDNKTIPRDELLDTLIKEKPDEVLVEIDNKTYTPPEAKKQFPENIPPYQLIHPDKTPINPEKIPEILGYPGHYQVVPAEPQETNPEITKEDVDHLINNNNPENVKIQPTEKETLTLPDFKEKYHDKVPDNTKLVDTNGKPLDTETTNNVLKKDPNNVPNVMLDNKLYTPTKILHNIVKNKNPQNVKIIMNGKTYEPEDLIKEYPNKLPSPITLIDSKGKPIEHKQIPTVMGKPDNYEIVPNNISPHNKAPLTHNHQPSVVLDGHKYDPTDVLKKIVNSQNPENVSVEINGNTYSPFEAIEKFPEKLPPYTLVGPDKNPIKPETIPEVMGQPGHYIIKPVETRPSITKPDIDHLIENNPTNVHIDDGEEVLTPEKIIGKHPENIPEGATLVDPEGKPLDPETANTVLKKDPNILPNVLLGNNRFTPQDVINEIIKSNNPDGVKVKIDGNTFTPEEAIKEYPDKFPEAILIGPDNKPLKHEEIPSAMGKPNEYEPSTPVNHHHQPSVVLDGNKYDPNDVINKIVNSQNPENVSVEINGKTYTPSEVIKKFPNKMPPYTLVGPDKKPIKPETIPEVMGQPGHYIIKPVETRPSITKPDIDNLIENNPTNVHIDDGEEVLTPKKIIEKHPENIPEDATLVDPEGKPLDPETANTVLKKDPNILPNVLLDNNRFTPHDVINEIIKSNNPDGVKVKIDGNTFTPEEAIKEYPDKFPDAILIGPDNKPLKHEEIPSAMGKPNEYEPTSTEVHPTNAAKTNFPTIKIDGKMFTPDKTIKHLAKNNPKDVRVLYNNTIYTPKEFENKFPDNIPHDFQLIDSNNDPVKHKDIPKVLSFDGNYNHTSTTITHPATKKIIDKLIKNNPKEHKIQIGGNIYTPEEVLKKFGNDIPKEAIVVDKNNKPIKPTEDDEDDDNFPPIKLDDNLYTPEDTVKKLVKDNPLGVKIVSNGNTYTPKEFLNKHKGGDFPPIKIITPDGKPIPNELIPSMFGYNNDEYIQVPYKIKDVLKHLINNNPNKILVEYKGNTYTPEAFLAEHPNEIPKGVKFVHKDKKTPINDEGLEQIMNEPHYIPNTEYNGNNFTPEKILDMLIKNNPDHLSVKINGKKYDPKDVPQHFPDGVPENQYELIDSDNNIVSPSEIGSIIQNAIPVFPHVTSDGKEYSPHDLLEMLSKNNPEKYKVRTIDGNTYTPEEYLKLDDSDKNQFEMIKNNKVVSPDEVNNKIDWPKEKADKFPNIIYNSIEYTPEDLLAMLGGNNKNQLKVLFEGNHYTPPEFLKKYKELPKNFKITKDGKPLSIEEIGKHIPWPSVDSFPTFELENNRTYEPQELIEDLSKNNPNHYLVIFNGKSYTPEQFLKEHPKIPSQFSIKKNGKIVKPNKVVKSIIYGGRPKTNFPIVDVNKKKYEPQESVNILVKNNPNNLKIKYHNQVYTPKEFADLKDPIPWDFELLDKDGNIISPYNVIDVIPWPGFNNVKLFPPITINGEPIGHDEVIESLIKNNTHNLKVKYKGNMYTPQDFKNELNNRIPPDFQLYKDGEEIDLKKLTQYVHFDLKKKYFNPVIVDNVKYTPIDILEKYVKNNPDNIKVLHKNNEYDPKDYIQKFDPVPTDFQLTKNGSVLDTESPAFITSLGFSVTGFPTVTIGKKQFGVVQTLNILKQHNDNNLKVFFDGDTYTIEEYMEECDNSPSDFIKLLHPDGKPINENDIINLVGLKYYNNYKN